MSTTTRFPLGTFAFSPAHQRLVRVLSRKGKTLSLTPALYSDGMVLKEEVKDENLMEVKEFEAWARNQPWFKPQPPARDLTEVLARLRAFCGRPGDRPC